LHLGKCRCDVHCTTPPGHGKSSPLTKATYVIFEIMTKANNHPIRRIWSPWPGTWQFLVQKNWFMLWISNPEPLSDQGCQMVCF
jgi:hypothetical protein